MKSKPITVKKDTGWLKCFYFPSGLSKGEGKVLSYILQHKRLRGYDNAVINKDGGTATTETILKNMGLSYTSANRRFIQGLKDRGIIAKNKGIIYLNPYIAYKGATVLNTTLELFESYRYGEEELAGVLE